MNAVSLGGPENITGSLDKKYARLQRTNVEPGVRPESRHEGAGQVQAEKAREETSGAMPGVLTPAPLPVQPTLRTRRDEQPDGVPSAED